MNADNESKRWLPWTREKDTKAQLIAAVFGLLTAVVVSGTGYLRVDKFGLSDHLRAVETERFITNADLAALENRLSKEFRKMLRDQYLLKSEYVEKHADMRAAVKAISSNDKEMRKDIRSTNLAMAKLPPQDLQNAVASNEIRIEHLEREHEWMLKTLRVPEEHRAR